MNLEVKVLIDVINPLDFFKNVPPQLALGYSYSACEIIQRIIPKSKVAEAFNTVCSPHHVHSNFYNGTTYNVCMW